MCVPAQLTAPVVLALVQRVDDLNGHPAHFAWVEPTLDGKSRHSHSPLRQRPCRGTWPHKRTGGLPMFPPTSPERPDGFGAKCLQWSSVECGCSAAKTPPSGGKRARPAYDRLAITVNHFTSKGDTRPLRPSSIHQPVPGQGPAPVVRLEAPAPAHRRGQPIGEHPPVPRAAPPPRRPAERRPPAGAPRHPAGG